MSFIEPSRQFSNGWSGSQDVLSVSLRVGLTKLDQARLRDGMLEGEMARCCQHNRTVTSDRWAFIRPHRVFWSNLDFNICLWDTDTFRKKSSSFSFSKWDHSGYENRDLKLGNQQRYHGWRESLFSTNPRSNEQPTVTLMVNNRVEEMWLGWRASKIAVFHEINHEYLIFDSISRLDSLSFFSNF
jgi:hypothetical protein